MTSLRQTMFQAVFSELINRASKLTIEKRRRTGPRPEGKGHLDGRPQMAIPVLEPRGQSFAAESEDASDVPDTPSDSAIGRESEVRCTTPPQPGQLATGRCNSHPLAPGLESSRTRSSGVAYAPAHVDQKRHYLIHPYADEADDFAEITVGSSNFPQIAQVLRGLMTTCFMSTGSTCYLNSVLTAQVWTTLFWGAWTQPILSMFITHAGEAHNPCHVVFR